MKTTKTTDETGRKVRYEGYDAKGNKWTFRKVAHDGRWEASTSMDVVDALRKKYNISLITLRFTTRKAAVEFADKITEGL